MSDVMIARLGLLANLMFWPLMFAMAAMRSDYSHLHQAVSELGAVGAPSMWLWNVAGYLVPGLLLAVFGWNFVRRVRPGSRVVAALLATAGVGMAISGVFPPDMNDRGGVQTMLHLLGSSLSALAWLPAMVALVFFARRTRPDIAVACGSAILAMIGAFALYGVLEHTPALVQRITFGVFFGWYAVAALLLMRSRASVVVQAGA
jgi:hypothetical membrane protein